MYITLVCKPYKQIMCSPRNTSANGEEYEISLNLLMTKFSKS